LQLIHGILGYCFLLVVVMHISAALMHALVRRDDVLESMVGSDE
jgi:cytochrome b561